MGFSYVEMFMRYRGVGAWVNRVTGGRQAVRGTVNLAFRGGVPFGSVCTSLHEQAPLFEL